MVERLRRETDLIDFATDSVADALKDADLAVLAMPTGAMAAVVDRFPEVSGGTALLVTDVGSVKGPVMREIAPAVAAKGAVFIGSHPMAGSEKAGLEHADGGLFEDAAVILTGDGEGGAGDEGSEEFRRLSRFWQALGGRVSTMSAGRHDELVGLISHLPHLVAAALVRTVSARDEEAGAFCGGGFRDTTRVASGPEEMWAGILADNAPVVSAQLGAFLAELETWKEALDELDRDRLRGFLSGARSFRESLRETASEL